MTIVVEDKAGWKQAIVEAEVGEEGKAGMEGRAKAAVVRRSNLVKATIKMVAAVREAGRNLIITIMVEEAEDMITKAETTMEEAVMDEAAEVAGTAGEAGTAEEEGLTTLAPTNHHLQPLFISRTTVTVYLRRC